MTENVKGGIEAGASDETVEQDIDPELVEDEEDDAQGEPEPVELPEYDPTQFEEGDE